MIGGQDILDGAQARHRPRYLAKGDLDAKGQLHLLDEGRDESDHEGQRRNQPGHEGYEREQQDPAH